MDQHLDSFFTFHSLSDSRSLPELLAQLRGGFTKPIIKEYLTAKRNCLDALFNSDNVDTVISNIAYYLQEKASYSPWIMEHLLMWVKDQPPTPYIHFLSYRIVELSYANPQLLHPTHDYINAEKNWDCQPNSAHLVTMQLERHGYLAAILAQDSKRRREAINLALNVGFLPPNAPLLYAMYLKSPKKTQTIIHSYAENHPLLFRDTLLQIFTNETHQKQQFQLLAANLHPSIADVYYPLFALKQITETQRKPDEAQLIALWIRLIDSGLLSTPYLLASKTNQAIFKTLQKISDFHQNTTLSFAQTKILCTTLAKYRATQLDPSSTRPPNIMMSLFFGSPKIRYLPEADWADQLYYQLLYKIAYPDPTQPQQMDFANIVRFLDITFNLPSEQPNTVETLQETMSKDYIEYQKSHSKLNYDHQDKLLHSFLQLFFETQKQVEITPTSYPQTLIRELPTLCLHILDLAVLPEHVIIPPWFSITAKQTVLSIMQLPITQQSIMSAYTADMFRSLDDSDLETQSMVDRMIPASLNPKTQEKRIQHACYFMTQLYLAYCKAHQNPSNTNCPYTQFIQTTKFKSTLENDSQAIDAFTKSIHKTLNDHHDACLTYVGFWACLGWIFGYSKPQSDLQLDHFKQIKAFIKYRDIRNLDECRELIKIVDDAITKRTFKRYFWLSSFYHNYLITLHQKLCQIEAKLIAQPLSAKDNDDTREESDAETREWTKESKPTPSFGDLHTGSLFQPTRTRSQSTPVLTLVATPGYADEFAERKRAYSM